MPPVTLDRLRWLWPTLVLAAAAALRFVALDQPETLVFDELFYVRDAISQLAHGYATTWPDSEPDMSGDRPYRFSSEAAYVAHPPLGKWLIGLGILVFGPESGWGWRSATALAGVTTVAVTMRLGWLMSRSLLVACLAGLVLAFDGVHIVLSRVALLDGLLTLAVMVGALCMWRDHQAVGGFAERWVLRKGEASRTRGLAVSLAGRAFGPVFWRRPWLLAAGASFGAAAGIKWSGLYPLAAFLLFTVIRDLVIRYRVGVRAPIRGALLQTVVTGLIALPIAAVAYLTTWAGWILTTGGWGRDTEGSWIAALADYHRGLLAWHASLTAEHPYQSHPLGWPIGLRPTAMYHARWAEGVGCPWEGGCIAGITPIPNPIVTWGGVAALLMLVIVVAAGIRRPLFTDPMRSAGAFVLVGYLSGWIPWVFTFSRSAVFQFYTVVLTPFAALAMALLLAAAAGATIVGDRGSTFRWGGSREALRGRRISVALLGLAVIALGLWFFPLWSAIPVAQWFWGLHLWLPGWA